LVLARGDLVAAETATAALLAEARKLGDLRGLSTLLPVWAECLTWQGRFSEALEGLAQDLAVLRAAAVPTYYFRTLIAAASAETRLGRLGRGQELVDELAANIRKGEYLNLRLEAALVGARILLISDEGELALSSAQDLLRRAEEPGLVVTAARARALLAEALWVTGEHEKASEQFDRSIADLVAIGHMPAIAEAVAGRARAFAASEPVEDLFAPTADWLEEQPVHLLSTALTMARARHAVAVGTAGDSLEVAEAALDGIAAGLVGTEAAAMRVHPWGREIKLLRSRLKVG